MTILAFSLGIALFVVAVLAVVARARLRAQIARVEAFSNETFAGTTPARTVRAIESLLGWHAENEHRVRMMHAVTGLPTREPLAQRMERDRRGTLTLLLLHDYDRLCLFDDGLAERLLIDLCGRIRAMLPADRFVAQVDRTHLAIWAGPELDGAGAQSEIAALTYALGEKLVVGGEQIQPRVTTRSSRYDSASDPPQTAIARLLAAFSVEDGGEGTGHRRSQARDDYAIEQDLRQAVARRELRLVYQPLVDAMAMRVCGAEALLRWDHPQRGPVPPATFIPVAETVGLAPEIGLWSLTRALRDVRVWLGAGLGDMRVAVNVSGRQLDDGRLADTVARLLDRQGLKAQALEVELTESIALADDRRAAEFCTAMRDQGVAVAIDDFGTGYSSLSALRNLAFDKLKIDRSFVTEVHLRRDSQAICNSLMALGRGLGIKVLAEGVETVEEYQWLRRNGCRFFQGYYFSRPVPREAFAAFAKDEDRLAALFAVAHTHPSQRLSA